MAAGTSLSRELLHPIYPGNVLLTNMWARDMLLGEAYLPEADLQGVEAHPRTPRVIRPWRRRAIRI